MKERVLRLWEKNKAKEYYNVWKKGTRTYDEPIERDGYCHEWNYYMWAGAEIHHNIEDDKIAVFCDDKVWREA